MKKTIEVVSALLAELRDMRQRTALEDYYRKTESMKWWQKLATSRLNEQGLNEEAQRIENVEWGNGTYGGMDPEQDLDFAQDQCDAILDGYLDATERYGPLSAAPSASPDRRTVVSDDRNLNNGNEQVRLVLTRFHEVAVLLRKPRAGHKGFIVADEYDAQLLLRALLSVFFDDVRSEEWTPSYAGSSTRVDFFVKAIGVAIEVKITRSGHAEKEIGSELIEDIAHYRRAGFKRLFCLVYDPGSFIHNPAGLKNDLSNEDNSFVEVLVVPPRY